MQQGVRQRLVGAIVLICLALIIWPIIFSGYDDHIVDETSQIPSAPDFETFEVAAPSIPGSMPPKVHYQLEEEPADMAQADTDHETPVTPEVAAPAKALSDEGLPYYWVLQLASFQDKDKANAFKDKLIASGYSADIKSVEQGAKTLYRVFIGPKFQKSTLQSIQKEVDKAFSVKSLLLRVAPNTQ